MLLHTLVPQAISVLQDFPVSLAIQYGQLLSKHPARLICRPTASTLRGEYDILPAKRRLSLVNYHSSLSSLKLRSCWTCAFNTRPCDFLSGLLLFLSSRLCCCASTVQQPPLSAGFLPPVPLIAVPGGCQICALSEVFSSRTLRSQALTPTSSSLVDSAALDFSSHSTLSLFQPCRSSLSPEES